MKKLFTILLVVFVLFSTSELVAQKKIPIPPTSEIRQLPRLEMKTGKKEHPVAYLKGIKNDKLLLFQDIAPRSQFKSVFIEKQITIDGIDEIRASKRKDRILWGVVGGAVLGAISYKIANRYTKTQQENLALRALGQSNSGNTVESIIGGVTGFGLGVMIGAQLSEKRLNVRKNKREALKILKAYSY